MSILGDIDDVLTDWHGSNDAMVWTAEPRWTERITVTLTADDSRFLEAAAKMGAAIGRITAGMAAMKPALERAASACQGVQSLLAEPRPCALDARYHRRYRNRQGRR
jgi:hypothetical protein